MENHSKIAVIGGDQRQAVIAATLADEGYEVALFANTSDKSGDATKATELEGAINGSRAVVLPLPCSADKVTLMTPNYDKTIYLSSLVSLLDNQVVYGGMTKVLRDLYSGEIIDYFEDEQLQILNAIPTAEGAVAIAMDLLPITLHSAKCLVVGYGRVAKALTKVLAALGADVTVMARKKSDFAYCEVYGYHTAEFSELDFGLIDFDVIFNTVPEKIFTEHVLNGISSNTVIIDLASRPGGVDFEAASAFGLTVNWALSLPGKVAPVTAGKIITKSIINSLKEKGLKGW